MVCAVPTSVPAGPTSAPAAASTVSDATKATEQRPVQAGESGLGEREDSSLEHRRRGISAPWKHPEGAGCAVAQAGEGKDFPSGPRRWDNPAISSEVRRRGNREGDPGPEDISHRCGSRSGSGDGASSRSPMTSSLRRRGIHFCDSDFPSIRDSIRFGSKQRKFGPPFVDHDLKFRFAINKREFSFEEVSVDTLKTKDTSIRLHWNSYRRTKSSEDLLSDNCVQFRREQGIGGSDRWFRRPPKVKLVLGILGPRPSEKPRGVHLSVEGHKGKRDPETGLFSLPDSSYLTRIGGGTHLLRATLILPHLLLPPPLISLSS